MIGVVLGDFVHNPLRGLEGTPAWAAIEDLQPYHGGGDNELLGILHALSIEDKHRVVPQTVTAVIHPGPGPSLAIAPNDDAGEILDVHVHMGQPLEHGTDLVTIKLAPTGLQPEVVMKGKLTFSIGFGVEAYRSRLVAETARTTLRIVREFESRFF